MFHITNDHRNANQNYSKISPHACQEDYSLVAQMIKNLRTAQHTHIQYMCVHTHTHTFSLSQFSSFTQSCPTLCDPMDRSTPGLPVRHQLSEFTQTSNEYSGLISFRMDWFDLLAVQGTLKRLLQYHSSKASILWHSAFFIVQLSHPYMTTGKTSSFDQTDLCWQSNVSAF